MYNFFPSPLYLEHFLNDYSISYMGLALCLNDGMISESAVFQNLCDKRKHACMPYTEPFSCINEMKERNLNLKSFELVLHLITSYTLIFQHLLGVILNI